MFKPGDIAGVRRLEGLRVIISSDPIPEMSMYQWPVATNSGVYDETQLFVAHPTVLATAEGRHLDTESFLRDLFEDRAKADEMLSYELLDQVEKALAEASVDFNGHWRNGAAICKGFNLLETMLLNRGSLTKKDAEDIIRAVDAGTPLNRWISVGMGLRMSLRTCPFCGGENFETITNGQVIRLAGYTCKFPNGLPLTEWELNVPSGKLLVANDLRDLFPLPGGENFDINMTLGCRQTALAYAANGLAHAFVGNTCPSVYKCADGTYKIATRPSEEEWDGKKYVKIDPPLPFEGKEVAGICTDLWWYSLCDQEEFQRRCERFEKKPKKFDVKVVNVKPGVYRFRHDEEACGKEGPKECVFSRFKWVRNPDPVKDFLALYEEVEVNVHAYVQAQVAKWPTLYGKIEDRHSGKEKVIPWADMSEEDRLHSWQQVADHIFCTIGGGTEWHEKGFPRAMVDRSIPDVEPPTFRAQYHWYPFSESYGGFFEVKTLAPSFAKLAFRILESVISFGMVVNDNAHSREVPYVRERMLLAVKRYREMAKQYPDLADPEYVAWLSQKGRAEAWVENFDLGPEFTKKHREHARRQRWAPEDAYAVEFDARKLKDGHFAWHPKEPSVGGCWASKENAQRYAINEWSDNQRPPEQNCFWTSHARNTSIPLYSVARVVKLGEVSHMGETLVEISFDYGTPWMKDPSKRKALAEAGEKDAIRVLSREEYEKLLPEAIQFFEDAEAWIKGPRKK